MPADGYTTRAADAISEAVTAGEDFTGRLATALTHVAARCGSTDALTARRPGSWEAELVTRLASGTASPGDEDLCRYGLEPPNG